MACVGVGVACVGGYGLCGLCGWMWLVRVGVACVGYMGGCGLCEWVWLGWV